VQQEIFDTLGALPLQRFGPEVAREVSKLFREREDHNLKH